MAVLKCVAACSARIRAHDCALQCVAVCCSVLQCAAVCCSLLQCVGGYDASVRALVAVMSQDRCVSMT